MSKELETLFESLFSPSYKRSPCGILHGADSVEPKRECAPGFVYVAKCGDLFKIGCSVSTRGYVNVLSRLKDFKRITGLQLEFRHAIETHCARGLEKHLHNHFKERRKPRELFWLSTRDLNYIETLDNFVGQPVKHHVVSPSTE